MHRGCFVWTPIPPLLGRRTPRLGPARVCVRALLGRVGRAGLPGAFRCASPFLWPFFVRSLLVLPPPGRGCPVCGCCWVFFFFPLSPPCCAPVVSCFACFPAPGALGLSVLSPPTPPPFCPLPPTLCAPLSPAFRVFRPRMPWASGSCCPPPLCCLWRFQLYGCLGPLRPPPLFFFPSFFFSGCVVRRDLCFLGRRVCPRVPRWCCPCRCSVCAGWCCVVFAVGPGCPVLSPAGCWCRASVVLSLSGRVARRPVVRRGVSWCSAALCCVLLRCAVVWWCAVVLCRLFASLPVPVVCFLPLRVCCVCFGVSCCVFLVPSALCGAVRVVCAVPGGWCCWFPVSLPFVGGLLVALVARRRRLVVCVGFDARVWFGCRSASSLCCVLWRCAAVWFCAMVPCLLFFVLLLAGGAGFLLFPVDSRLRAGYGAFLFLCSACAVLCWCACLVALCSVLSCRRGAGWCFVLLPVVFVCLLFGLAVLCCLLVGPGGSWCRVSLACCGVSLGAVLPRVAARCAAWRCVVVRCVVSFCSAWCCRTLCCVLGRCPSSWGPVPSGAVFCLVPPRCVCFAVVCRCVVLFAVVLCAVCALGCCVVRLLLYLLECKA